MTLSNCSSNEFTSMLNLLRHRNTNRSRPKSTLSRLISSPRVGSSIRSNDNGMNCSTGCSNDCNMLILENGFIPEQRRFLQIKQFLEWTLGPSHHFRIQRTRLREYARFRLFRFNRQSVFLSQITIICNYSRRSRDILLRALGCACTFACWGGILGIIALVVLVLVLCAIIHKVRPGRAVNNGGGSFDTTSGRATSACGGYSRTFTVEDFDDGVCFHTEVFGKFVDVFLCSTAWCNDFGV
mmetsp:Transcript_8797/g.13293  ORF Transcript_8797/g.13293 Transcript_8797/m.13293 type:complete len:240 (-) Transcript_8797:179-898(-)